MESLEKQKKKHNEFLKVVAIVTMLIDHIGLIFYPEYPILRIIGRIAFPIFAFQIAKGYVYTSNRMLYISRLFIFAIISQIPYLLLLQTNSLNILFTLFLAILLIQFIDNKKWLWALLIVIISIIPEFTFLPKFEYSWYGVTTPLIYYIFKDSKIKIILLFTTTTLIYVFLHHLLPIQYFAVIGILLCLYFPVEKFCIYINKYVFYWFYPAHLILLLILFLLT